MILSEEEKNRIRGLHKMHSVIKEQGAMTWTCEQQPNCHCVPTPNWGGPGPGAYATQADCMQDSSNCCSQGGGGTEWACMGGPNANGCQSGPVGSFQIGQGGVMGIYTDQNTCVGSCTSGFGWECNPSGAAGCVSTAAGPYNSMSQCVQSCGSYGDDKYNCVNNSCTAVSPTDPGYNSADFLTMDDCEDSMCGDRRAPIQPRGPKASMPVDNSYARKGNPNQIKRER